MHFLCIIMRLGFEGCFVYIDAAKSAVQLLKQNLVYLSRRIKLLDKFRFKKCEVILSTNYM